MVSELFKINKTNKMLQKVPANLPPELRELLEQLNRLRG